VSPWVCGARGKPGLPHGADLGCLTARLWCPDRWVNNAVIAQAGAILFAAVAWVLAYMLAYRWIPPVITKALVFEWRWRIS
jgi:hypothetical protein